MTLFVALGFRHTDTRHVLFKQHMAYDTAFQTPLPTNTPTQVKNRHAGSIDTMTKRLAALTFFLLFLFISLPQQASAEKRLRIAFPVAETGFDPAKNSDAYSVTVEEAIFERLVSYEYRTRPIKISGCTAQTIQRSQDLKTYTFTLKHGIFFSPDPAFKGHPRELIAQDYIYSIKRLMDPALRSPWQFLVEGKIEGLDRQAQLATPQKPFDYDAPVAGLQALDRYTLRIQLTRPDPNFMSILAMPTLGAVAREVIEAYSDTNAHPIGTGAFALKDWQRSSRIILVRNPRYHSTEGENSARPPLKIDTVDIQIIEESQARWLAFRQHELDMIGLPPDLVPKALKGTKLIPELQKEGIQLQRCIDPEITYTYFNMLDPTVGGTSPAHIALRRALSLAYDVQLEIRVLQHDQAIAAEQLVSQGLPGFIPNYQMNSQYNPTLANRLLDYYGYRLGADGWRTQPDGKPLLITLSSFTDSRSRMYDELWTRSAKQIGVHLVINKAKFPEILKAEKACKLQMRNAAWFADYADGDNFTMLLYGKNIHQNNNACFADPLYDQWYTQSQLLPDSPERNKLYYKMNERIRVLAPWKLDISRYRNSLVHQRVKGFQQHQLIHADWMYLDLAQ
jgi:oligopeptide transport system substrate-binding protein